MRTYKVGSLFAGVGGVCLGFQNAKTNNAKYKLVWANEMDEYACETYKTNFKHKLIQGDIRKILNPEVINEDIRDLEKLRDKCDEYNTRKKYELQIEELKQEITKFKQKNTSILEDKIDILLGGFPCQAFSIAGERKGFEDNRGNLFLSILDVIKQLDQTHGKPRMLFLENVKNLKSHDGGNTYKVIREKLEEVGYKIKEHVLNTMTYSNLPQNREREYT